MALFKEKKTYLSVPLFYRIGRIVGRQTWLRWGLRYKVFTYLPPIDYEFTTPFYGRTYRGNFNNFIDRVVYFFGAHEKQVMEYSETLIPKDAVVLDIGANVGHHSLFFSTKAKEVHSFEPNDAFRPQFDSLMKENKIENVHLHMFGLGDQTQEATYYAPTGDNHGIGSFVKEHDQSNTSIGTMKIVQADEAVVRLALPRIDFIKIDVERYEESVLRGLQKTIRTYKPVIVMEYAPGDFSSFQSFHALTRGYTAYLIRTNTSRLFFFNNPKPRLLPFDALHSHGEVLLLPKSDIVTHIL